MSIGGKEHGKNPETFVYKNRYLSYFTDLTDLLPVDGYMVASTGDPIVVVKRSIQSLETEKECSIDYLFLDEDRASHTRISANSDSPYVVLQMMLMLHGETTLFGEAGYDEKSGEVCYANLSHTRNATGDLVMSAAQWDFEKEKLYIFSSLHSYDTGVPTTQKNKLTRGQPTFVQPFAFKYGQISEDTLFIQSDVNQRGRILQFPIKIWENPLEDAFTGRQWVKNMDFLESKTSLEYKII